jgi:hypothetical protein
MGIAEQILINLLAAFAGFLIASAWKGSRRRLVYWQSWRFWRPFFSGDVKIVVDRFNQFNSWEASGLVGVGGMQATAEIVSLLDDLGIRASGRQVSIVYHDRVDGNVHGSNLICIGGPDANSMTKLILQRLDLSIRLGIPEQHNIVITDLETGRPYFPKIESAGRGDDRVTLDHGVIIKSQNPFNRKRCVLIVAGSYGFGTWAAAKLIHSRQFLTSAPVKRGLDIECLFKAEVIDEIPQEPEMILTRKISVRRAEAGN